MTKTIAAALLCWVCVLPTPAADTEAADWELRRDKDGVQVYTGTVANSSFKAVKATAVISTTVPELVALVRDVDACSEWAAFCEQTAIIESTSESEMLIYTLNNMPWPVSDRDAVTRVIWTGDLSGETGDTVTMTATVVAGSDTELAARWQPKRGKVRLSYGVTRWTFKPRKSAEVNGPAVAQVEVSSYAHVDPGGAVPAWLTNRLLVDAPFDTVVAMRKLVQTGRYKDARPDL